MKNCLWCWIVFFSIELSVVNWSNDWWTYFSSSIIFAFKIYNRWFQMKLKKYSLFLLTMKIKYFSRIPWKKMFGLTKEKRNFYQIDFFLIRGSRFPLFFFCSPKYKWREEQFICSIFSRRSTTTKIDQNVLLGIILMYLRDFFMLFNKCKEVSSYSFFFNFYLLIDEENVWSMFFFKDIFLFSRQKKCFLFLQKKKNSKVFLLDDLMWELIEELSRENLFSFYSSNQIEETTIFSLFFSNDRNSSYWPIISLYPRRKNLFFFSIMSIWLKLIQLLFR